MCAVVAAATSREPDGASVVASSHERVLERDQKLSLLLELGALLSREVELDAVLAALNARIAKALNCERSTVYVLDSVTGELRARIADHESLREIRVRVGQGIAGYVAETGEVVNVRDAASDPRHFSGVDRKTGYTTRTMLTAPIRDGRRAIRGVVQALNKKSGRFTDEDERFLLALTSQVALVFEGTTLRPAADDARGVHLRGRFNHIVGASAPVRRVYELVSRAAAVDATVLLRGETGVGKGLFARAIHANCARHDRPMVTVDCTTLPPALVESELFGHERGAYTGADQRVPGKVEIAEGGTLFLDEVGELPLAVQAKLLRFLQERTFERVGGRKTLRADVRVIAATHRDLEAQVQRGEFRQDLFYRLRVVEIAIPSLRERGPDEVSSLAEHFLAVYTRRHGRAAMCLTEGARAALRAHDWPGNVRELEHAIERAVVLAPDERIGPEHLGLPELRGVSPEENQPCVRESLRPEAPQGAVLLPLGLTLREAQERYAAATLAHFEGNRSRAARSLRVGRNTLKRKARAKPR